MKLRIATPCPKSWDELVGNNRVRYCRQCNLNVYNLAVIPRKEVQFLIRQKEGRRFCGRMYLRGDRKATTRDCPEGRDRVLIRRIVKTAAILLVASFGWVCHGYSGPSRDKYPSWVRNVLEQVDPTPDPRPAPKARTTTTVTPNSGGIVVGLLCPAKEPRDWVED